MTLEQKVALYQQTHCEILFNEIYGALADVLKSKVTSDGDIDSQINLVVYNCILKYDYKRNNCFEAYLRKYINFAHGKQKGKAADRAIREQTGEYDLLDDRDLFINVESAANMLHFQEALGMNEDESYTIECLAAGMWPSDIAADLGCSTSAVSARIRRIREKYPDMVNYLI